MEELINSICKALKPGDIYICWSGTVYDTRNRFIRMDKLFLNVLTCRSTDTGDVAEYTRILPCYLILPDTKEPVIKYSLQECCRITDGKRRGRIVPIFKVKDEERWTPAGVRKALVYSRAKGLHNSRKGDREIAILMRNFTPAGEAVDMESCLPKVFITMPHQRNNHLFVRRTGRALNRMRQMWGYTPELGVDDNIPRIREEAAVDAGNGRLGYDFDVFYGRGVVAAEMMGGSSCRLGTWYKVNALRANTGSMEIK